MILQALTHHYEDLLELGKISRPGWGMSKVSYGLELSDDGEVLDLLDIQRVEQRKDKLVKIPQEKTVPMPVKRSSGVSSNFLCDNSSYLLGADEKGNPERTQACFAACKKLHLDLLGEAQTPAAKAVVAFFEKWNPAEAAGHPAFEGRWPELMKGVNLIFWYEENPVSEEPEIRSLWQAHYNQTSGGAQIRCQVTGELSEPEEIHPAIKGVLGAQTSGAALVSFNAPAFCSYGHDYAPIGSYAAFAYTTALNHLLADREHVRHIGDTTVVFWAEGGQNVYQDVAFSAFYGDTTTENDLLRVLESLSKGAPVDWDKEKLDPSTRFYVLGLAPNAARLSVRFFWQNSFGMLARNVMEHYRALEIERPLYDDREILPVRSLLEETVNKKSRSPSPSKQMSGDVLRAILTGEHYPSTLLHGAMLRIRAEREITRGRVAILKAYYLRDRNSKIPKEALEVKLNEDCEYVPYVLGRLFSVLEGLQKNANPSIGTTVKDRYFNSASATPVTVFPTLIRLAQKHLDKLDIPGRIYFDKQITELLAKIKEPYPMRMTLMEQGAFQLGYYHQTQKNFTKKEEQ